MKSQILTAHEYIRERILSGEFAPGESLAAKHLAEMIGVSRTPVRDALRQLETEGLIEINPRQEAKVKNATYEEVRDIWELRIALETHAASLAALRHSAEDLNRLEELLSAMQANIEGMGKANNEDEKWCFHRKLGQNDIRFHLTILEASRNRLIKNEVDRFRIIQGIVLPLGKRPDPAQILKSPQENREIWQSHQSILTALRAQDETAAYLAMKEHLSVPMKLSLQRMREGVEDESSGNVVLT